MEPGSKRIAMVVHNYFEQSEMADVRKLLQDAGHTVDLIAPEGGEVQGLNHVDKGDSFTVDRTLSEAKPEEYDAVVLPGGVVNADHLRTVPEALNFVESIYNADKVVAAICHAPWVLVSLDIVEGKTLTSYFTLKDDIVHAGGNWVDQEVAQDGNIITSRNPDDIPAFARTIDELLAA